MQRGTTQPWQTYTRLVSRARGFEETQEYPVPRAEWIPQEAKGRDRDGGSHPGAPSGPTAAIYTVAETSGAWGEAGCSGRAGRRGSPGSRRRRLNPAGSSLSFSSKAKFPPWDRGQVSPAAPTSCLVWGLHPPACQLPANLAQLPGPWIPRPGLQPTRSSREGREGIPEQTVGQGQRLRLEWRVRGQSGSLRGHWSEPEALSPLWPLPGSQFSPECPGGKGA